MKSYNPVDWFWIVAGDSARFYSSRLNAYVDADGEEGAAFTAAGAMASSIASEAELAQVLRQQAPGLIPEWLYKATSFVQPAAGSYAPSQLIAYANIQQWALVTRGKLVTVGERDILFATSTDGRNLDGLTLMNGKVSRLAQANPPETVLWQIGATEFATIDAADFVTAATEVADWVQSTFDALPQIFATIEAGEITTLAQVDAALAQA